MRRKSARTINRAMQAPFAGATKRSLYQAQKPRHKKIQNLGYKIFLKNGNIIKSKKIITKEYTIVIYQNRMQTEMLKSEINKIEQRKKIGNEMKTNSWNPNKKT